MAQNRARNHAENEGTQDMFFVINTVTGANILTETGELLLLESGNVAAIHAATSTAETGQKHQVRRHIGDQDWRQREADRYATDRYVAPCWLSIDLVVPDHFVHLAENPELIAYTQNADKGAADIQTPIRIGAYLMKYFPDMGQDQVQQIVLRHSNTYSPAVLKIATTADDIVRVFTSGPRTCMSKSAEYYESHVHPAAVYGNSDLAAAYLTDDCDRVTARALIWPARLRMGRVYGDSSRLVNALRSAGYTDTSDFWGAKVRKIECENTGQLVLPYMDYWQTLSHFDADFLLIDRHGEITADQTNGLENYDRYTCDRCEDTENEHDLETVYTDQNYTAAWCCRCVRSHSFTCAGSNETVSCDYAVDIDGSLYSQWYADNHATHCDFQDQYTFENTVEVQTLRGFHTLYIQSENWSVTVIDDETFVCRITGERFANMLRADDSWSDEPRALHIFPTDLPADFEPDGTQPRYFNIHQDQRDFGLYARAAA